MMLEKLNLDHLAQMNFWGNNSNFLLKDYDIYFNSNLEAMYWLSVKTKNDKNKYFAIIENNSVVGYISLKNFKNDSATMGIVIGHKFQNNHFGSKAIDDILTLAFDEFKLKKVRLHVELFNRRAIHLYLKKGFEVSYFLYTIKEWKPNEIPDEYRMFFVFKEGFVLSKSMYMEVMSEIYRIR